MTETNEIWKDIPEYENLYKISSIGRVMSLNYLNTGKEKILKPRKEGKGYLKVTLSKEGEKKDFKIHRLVAQSFLDNPDNLPQINHRNEDKKDNRVENLEYCDAKYNNNFGTHTQRMAKAKSISVICVETGKIYQSARDIQRQLVFNQSNISKCCMDKYKSAYGFHWQYV